MPICKIYPNPQAKLEGNCSILRYVTTSVQVLFFLLFLKPSRFLTKIVCTLHINKFLCALAKTRFLCLPWLAATSSCIDEMWNSCTFDGV